MLPLIEDEPLGHPKVYINLVRNESLSILWNIGMAIQKIPSVSNFWVLIGLIFANTTTPDLKNIGLNFEVFSLQ